ncbi:hypothetical protein [Nocardia wallacei]|uniref:hypothetical protein n=1 Tax=Nocardia wallacei TaxID=480035 RepID=UPI0024545162|nr:hypothetical protein [Nocardia wallacei]
MGDYRTYTQAELEQKERDQQDPKWLEWVDPIRMNAQIYKLLNETVPDIPDNPWSPEGLDRAERYALDRFSSMDDVDKPENRDIADQLTRFIGEVFRRNFDGEWYNVPEMSGERYSDFGPVIRDEWSDAYLDTANLVTAAVHRKWGDYWSGIYSNSIETHKSWVEAGKPSLHEWLRIQESS